MAKNLIVMSGLALTVSMLLLSVPAQAYCIENWACIEEQHHNSGVDIVVSNRRPYPFTASIKVKAENASKQQRKRRHYRHTQVIEGNQSQVMLSLSRVDTRHPIEISKEFFWTPGNMHAEHSHQGYQKPFAPGEHYPVVQGFGGGYSHRGPSRYAVDFEMPVGTPVHAARAGVVIDTEASHSKGGPSREYADFANYVVILHEDGTTGEYYHLKHQGVAVAVGQQVEVGELIGYSGSTGFSSLPHLHFAVYRAKPFGKFESLPFEFSQ